MAVLISYKIRTPFGFVINAAAVSASFAAAVFFAVAAASSTAFAGNFEYKFCVKNLLKTAKNANFPFFSFVFTHAK